MCRICGRVVKCIFDSMPSRTSSAIRTRSYTTISRLQPTGSSNIASRAIVRPAVYTAEISTIKSPKLSLPFRSNLYQAASTQTSVSTASEATELPPSLLQSYQPQSISENSISDISIREPNPSKPLVLSKSVQQLLPLLSAQKPHYITAHVHRFPYLVTKGDTLRLPFHMHGVSSGDILRLNRASILGSRDYTLKAGTSSTETYDRKRTGEPNYLDERLFEVRARVLGVETGPMMVEEKTKRRNRRVKTVRSKHKYTVLKIMEVRVKSLEELQLEKGNLLLES